MNWFKRKKKTNNLNPTIISGYTPNIFTQNWADNSMLSLYSTIYAVIDRKSKSIAQLPISLYQKKDKDTKIINNELAFLVKERPEFNRTPYIFWRTLIAQKDIYGNAFALIIRDTKLNPIELKILDPLSVLIFIDKKTNDVFYRITNEDGIFDVHNTDILHFPSIYTSGYQGVSFLRALRNQLSLKNAITDVAKSQAESSVKIGGLLKLDANISEEAKKMYQEQFRRMYSENWASVMILEAGTEYERLKFEINDLKQDEINKITAKEVAMVSGIPLYMLGEGDAKYSNIEYQNIDFLQNCITPEVILIEQELKRKLLTEKQINEGYYFKFNVNALLRADMNSRANFYTKMVSLGAMTLNEVRELEELKSYGEIGDRPVVSLNYSFLDTLDQHERVQNEKNNRNGGENNQDERKNEDNKDYRDK